MDLRLCRAVELLSAVSLDGLVNDVIEQKSGRNIKGCKSCCFGVYVIQWI